MSSTAAGPFKVLSFQSSDSKHFRPFPSGSSCVQRINGGSTEAIVPVPNIGGSGKIPK